MLTGVRVGLKKSADYQIKTKSQLFESSVVEVTNICRSRLPETSQCNQNEWLETLNNMTLIHSQCHKFVYSLPSLKPKL